MAKVNNHPRTLKEIVERMEADIQSHEPYCKLSDAEKKKANPSPILFGHSQPFPSYAFYLIAKELIELKARVEKLEQN